MCADAFCTALCCPDVFTVLIAYACTHMYACARLCIIGYKKNTVKTSHIRAYLATVNARLTSSSIAQFLDAAHRGGYPLCIVRQVRPCLNAASSRVYVPVKRPMAPSSPVGKLTTECLHADQERAARLTKCCPAHTYINAMNDTVDRAWTASSRDGTKIEPGPGLGNGPLSSPTLSLVLHDVTTDGTCVHNAWPRGCQWAVVGRRHGVWARLHMGRDREEEEAGSKTIMAQHTWVLSARAPYHVRAGHVPCRSQDVAQRSAGWPEASR